MQKVSTPPTAAVTGAAGVLKRISGFQGGPKTSKSCPNCGHRSVVVYDGKSGDELCNRCGLVLEARVMSDEQEWRSFANNDGGGGGADKSRVGGPNDTWLEDTVQGTTMIGTTDRKHTRLLQTHEIATALGTSDKQLKSAFNNLRAIAEGFDLRQNVIERCKEMVKDLQTTNNLRNRTGKVYMLSVVYIACREEGITRTLRELVTFDHGITEKELGRAINRMKKIIPNRTTAMSFAAAELVPRLCSRLELSQQIASVADHVCKEAEKLLDRSHRPNSVASGAIFLVAQLTEAPTTVADIAAAAGTGDSTVRLIYKEMLPLATLLLPEHFKPTLAGGLDTLVKRKVISST